MEELIPQGWRKSPSPPPQLIPLEKSSDIEAVGLLGVVERRSLDGWNSLAARCKAPPFLGPGWLSCWWPAFGTGDFELRTLWRQERLAAVMPLARRRGHLESTANYHVPEYGMVAQDEMAATSLARELFAQAPARVTLSGLEPDGMTLRACKTAAAEVGFRVELRPHLDSPYVDLSQGWNRYRQGLSSHLLRNMRRGRKQLEEMSPLRVEKVTGGAELSETLEEAFRIEASGWKGRAGSAIQSRPHTLEFYRRMTAWAASQHLLRLYLLKFGERVLTMCLSVHQYGVCYMLKGGYDEEFKRFSPGNLLTEAIIEDCALNGIKRVEIYGEAETYKLNWASATTQYLRFEAFAPTAAGHLAWLSFRYARPFTSRARQALHLPQPGHRQ